MGGAVSTTYPAALSLNIVNSFTGVDSVQAGEDGSVPWVIR